MTDRVAHPSYCRICPALCGVLVDVEDGVAVSVRGDPDHPLSAGYTCPKGRMLADEHNAPDRLRSSLRRRPDGGWDTIGPGRAVAEIAARLAEIRDRHGPRAIALYVGTRGYEVLQLAGASAWLEGIGSPSLYSTYTIDQPGKDLARAMHGSWPAGFQDVGSSDVVLLAGLNPLISGYAPYTAFPVTNPRIELLERRRAGQRLIVIDPRRTETAALADIHLQPRPGHDAALLAAMVRVVLDEQLTDAGFVQAWSAGVELLHDAVRPFDPQCVAAVADVPVDDLIAAARLFAAGPRGCAIGGTGINMGPHPILAEYLLLCLNTLGGRYRRAGETVANPGVLTAGRALREGARAPRPIWGQGEQPRIRNLATMYGQMPSSALADEILTPGDGQIRALVVSGGNPLVALPNHAKVQRALRSLDLLVTLDVRMSQTAQISDYAIGCRLSLEKADTTLASDLRFPIPFAQYTPPIVEPAGELVEEWELFHDLSAAMGTPWCFGSRVGMPIPVDPSGELPPDRRPTSEELWEVLCAGGRVPLATLRQHPHGLAPAVGPVVVQPADPSNDDRLDLAAPEPWAELGQVAATFAERPGGDAPFRLVSRRLWRFHNSWGQDIDRLRAQHPASPAYLHPSDLASLGVDSGDLVEIRSATGSLRTTAVAAPELRPGVVSMPHCWGSPDWDEPALDGACVNLLVDDETGLTPIVGMARQSAVPVWVRRVEPAGDQPR